MKDNCDGFDIKAHDDSITWLVKHATWIYNRHLQHADGQTSYERLWKRTYNLSICEFAETVLYRPRRHDTPKSESNWIHKIWLGKCTQSDEHHIGTSECVIRTKDVKRRLESERYQIDIAWDSRPRSRRPHPRFGITAGGWGFRPRAAPVGSWRNGEGGVGWGWRDAAWRGKGAEESIPTLLEDYVVGRSNPSGSSACLVRSPLPIVLVTSIFGEGSLRTPPRVGVRRPGSPKTSCAIRNRLGGAVASLSCEPEGA